MPTAIVTGVSRGLGPAIDARRRARAGRRRAAHPHRGRLRTSPTPAARSSVRARTRASPSSDVRRSPRTKSD